MEDGIAFPTHARQARRLTAACPGEVARLPFGPSLAPQLEPLHSNSTSTGRNDRPASLSILSTTPCMIPGYMHCGSLYCAGLERTTTWLNLLLLQYQLTVDSMTQH